MRRNRLTVTALMCGSAFAAFVATSRAGIVPISRSSLIHIEGQAKTDDLGKDQSTNSFGAFNNTITSTGGDPNGTHANGSAGQNTIVDISMPGRISGSGSLSTSAFAQFSPQDLSGPLFVHATSNLTVVINVINNAEKFHAEGTFSDISPAGVVSHFSFQETSTPPAGQSALMFDDGNVSSMTFDENLSLHPGTYKIIAETGSGSSGSSPQDEFSFGESHSMNFSFSAGSGATAIPFPPTVWTGSLFLLVGAGAAVFSERRHRRI